MKKILLWTLAVLTLAPAQAQFSLRKNGQAIFGKRMNKTLIVNPTGQNTPQSVLSDNPMLVPIDTLASAVFLRGTYREFGSLHHLRRGQAFVDRRKGGHKRRCIRHQCSGTWHLERNIRRLQERHGVQFHAPCYRRPYLHFLFRSEGIQFHIDFRFKTQKKCATDRKQRCLKSESSLSGNGRLKLISATDFTSDSAVSINGGTLILEGENVKITGTNKFSGGKLTVNAETVTFDGEMEIEGCVVDINCK